MNAFPFLLMALIGFAGGYFVARPSPAVRAAEISLLTESHDALMAGIVLMGRQRDRLNQCAAENSALRRRRPHTGADLPSRRGFELF